MRGKRRVGILWGGLGVALLLSSGCGGGPQPVALKGEPPAGVVMVLVDALRADHLGAYGSKQRLTPALDSVASRGAVFLHATAASSWTRSSIASLMSSRYPSGIGVLNREDAVSPAVTLLPEVLKETGAFETLGVVTNGNASHVWGFRQGYDRYESSEIAASYPGDFRVPIAEGVTQKALRFLDRLQPGRRFFLFLHYVDTHDPYLPHPGLLPDPEPPGRFDGSRKQLTAMDRAQPDDLMRADYDRIRHLYAGAVKYCDLWIGKLLEGLERRQLRDRVILVVTADHGEALWDHGYRGHGRDLYQEMTGVPLLLQFPRDSGLPLPTTITEPVSLIDVAPTILSALQVPIPSAFRGIDLLPLVAGTVTAREPGAVYAEMDLDGRNFEAVRSGTLKLIRARGPAPREGALQLFDLAEDPTERRNLAMQGRGLETVRRLDRMLTDLSGSIAGDSIRAVRVGQDSIDPETLESLRALGYLNAPTPSSREDRPVGSELGPTVDFVNGKVDEQAIAGFSEREKRGRWMARRASVRLGRPGASAVWRIEGRTDSAGHGRNVLTLTVRVDGGPPRRHRIAPGSFVLTGPVPEGQGQVRLDLECDADVAPDATAGSGDERARCALVRVIRLDEGSQTNRERTAAARE